MSTINFDDVTIIEYSKRGEKAKEDALPERLLPLLEEAYNEMGHAVGEFGFDAEYTQSYVEVAYLNNANSFVLLVEYEGEFVGVFGGFLVPNMFSKEFIATEGFMYLKKPFRCGIIGKHMVRLFESWARDKGAKSVVFSSPVEHFRIEPLMKREGYERFELSFKKELGGD